MAQYATLKAAINQYITTNGNNEITGAILNNILDAMVDSLGANYGLGGVATPSTNPGTPDQNVFYLAFEAGTYTNFNNTVLPAGISTLMWNGSWTAQTWYTIDVKPTYNSNNFVKSGGVYEELALGAVYDVTAHNSGATFASLSALLSNANLNTLIPTSVRKGGMSIKFVQSSDNKYVQYRYMSSSTAVADFTNTANWQGVDEEVVAGSRNLVTSGGAANSVNQLTSFFKKYIIEGIDVESRINNLMGGDFVNVIYYQNFNTKDVKILAIATYQININVYIITASSFGSIPTKTEKIASVKADRVKKVKYLVLNKTLGSNEYLGISGGFMYGGAQGYKMCRARDGEVTNNFSLGFSIVDIYSISKESFEGLQQEVGGLQQEVGGLQQEVGGLQQEVEGLPEFIDSISVQGSLGKLPLDSYQSSYVNRVYVNFHNGTAPDNCKIKKIKFKKPSSSGTFKAYACNVTFSGGVPTVNALRQVYSKSFQNDSQEFIEENVNIKLAEGEYLGFTGNLTYGNTGDNSYWMVENQNRNIGHEIAVIYDYIELSKTKYDSQIEALQEDVQNLQEENVGYSKYIKLYENNLTQNNGLTVNGTWSFDSNGATPSATGSGTWFRLNKNYWSDKRFMQVEASMKSNTNLIITCTNFSVSDGEGASCFAVDFASGLLKIFSVGAGDDQATASGYTSTVLESEDISDIVAEHTYRIRLYKDSTLHTLEITDMLTGITKSVSHNGWAAGRQNQRYGFYVNSGSLPTLKNISIYTLNRPNVVFTGDSITEGVMVTNRAKRYAELYRTNHPHLKVVISAMGARQLSDIISMFDNEWAICKPKILSCLIGANGGNSQNGFESLKAKCDSIGCKLIVHYCTCQQSDDSHIAKNELIGSLPYRGARFDIATAKDNYPLVDSQHLAPRYNSSLYYDSGLHPNIDGDEAMYSRMMLDCIELDIE